MAKESLAVSWSYQMLSTWVLHWGHNEAGDFCTSLETLQLLQGVLVLWAKGQGLAQNPPGQQGKSHVGNIQTPRIAQAVFCPSAQ